MSDSEALKQEKLRLLEEKIRLKRELPHLYGWKNYKWQREFLEATEKEVFLNAANQLGKSSVQIRKIVDWATNVKLWPSLWRTKPRVFWYLYPSKDVATAEFDDKWIPNFMPNGSMKKHPIYGWKEFRDARRQIISVVFNSGVTIYFKTYSQDATNLQTATVHYIACDEELPGELYDELNFRRNAVDGYFSMVFTATLGQEMWRLTMQPGANDKEKFPNAWKKQVSLYDSMYFEDGTPSIWTQEKITRTIELCKNEQEVQRRVFGKFIVEDGLKYSSFDPNNNIIKAFKIPMDWYRYVGVDIGAGGESNHPSAISFIAVSPDYTRGVVYRHWRGSDQVYTVSDVANKYLELRGSDPITEGYYDYHCKDFKTITDRMGLSFTAAEKRHDIGVPIINTLFQNRMLFIFDIDECAPIVNEYLSLQESTDKRRAKDDSVDSIRYGVVKIPWAFEKVASVPKQDFQAPRPLTPMEEAQRDRMADRHRMFQDMRNDNSSLVNSVEEELSQWGELYDF